MEILCEDLETGSLLNTARLLENLRDSQGLLQTLRDSERLIETLEDFVRFLASLRDQETLKDFESLSKILVEPDSLRQTVTDLGHYE